MYRFDTALRARLAGNLAGFERLAQTAADLQAAAVAVTIVPDPEGVACFVITRRAETLSSHGGQWALPGGRIDPGETHEQAALRELSEEVGLVLDPERVLGRLDDFATRSGYCITPVVVWGGPRAELRPNPAEVAAVHSVPVHALDSPEVPLLTRIPESDRPVLSVPIAQLDTSIHAPTAALLYQLREVALHGRTTRVGRSEQPVVAWS